ncbi:MAG: hypothetical protein GXY19_08810 [Phycisphaerae bacterium]|nr:hypothetical protein [Phycisphaerae bacterium]
MSLVSVNWNPSRKDLNGFRLVSVIATMAIAVLLYAIKGLDIRWCGGIVAFGVLVWLSGLVSLTLTRCVYVVLMAVTLPIGFVVSLILMGAFYFGLITPLGLVFRLLGRDVLCRKFDPKAPTYWTPHEQTKNVERYFQQF